MTFRLSPPAEAAGYGLEVHETIGSTNARAVELAAAGTPGPLWIVSSRQEAGRGRRGRPWSTPQGNLAATLLVTGEGTVAAAATLGFVAGLSLSDALAALAPDLDVSVGADGASGIDAAGRRGRLALKWPNDVLAGGAKLAGILMESALLPAPAGEAASGPGGGYAAAVGIGVNVVSHPGDLAYPATSLKAMGLAVTAEDVFLALSDAWLDNVVLWDEGRNLDAVRRKWLGRAAGLGGPVAVNIDGTVMRGTFETIDEDCRFVIRRGDGSRVRVTAGDVHFGAVASAAHG